MESNSKARMQFTKLQTLASYKPQVKVVTKVNQENLYYPTVANKVIKAMTETPMTR